MVEFLPIDLAIWVAVLGLSIAVLLRASDYFTDSAETVGLSFRIPAFVVGVTIVAVGTSLPELVSSIIAVLAGSSEIVAGNVVGSNIANIFLVLGIAAIISGGLRTSYELVRVDLPMLVGSAFLLTVFIWDGVFNIYEGILSLLAFIIYVSYAVHTQRERKFKKPIEKPEESRISTKTILILLVSSVFIYIGAKFTIDSVIQLSNILNIGTEILAASVIALGTSLPELVVSLRAASRGKKEIAMGNILGSNIFNSLVVMGIPVFFGTLIYLDF